MAIGVTYTGDDLGVALKGVIDFGKEEVVQTIDYTVALVNDDGQGGPFAKGRVQPSTDNILATATYQGFTCFLGDTQVVMANGASTKAMADVRIGDVLLGGNKVAGGVTRGA